MTYTPTVIPSQRKELSESLQNPRQITSTKRRRTKASESEKIPGERQDCGHIRQQAPAPS